MEFARATYPERYFGFERVSNDKTFILCWLGKYQELLLGKQNVANLTSKIGANSLF